MEEVDVRGGLEWALCRLLKKDRYLLEKDVHEQSITSTLACYLREPFSPEYTCACSSWC